MIKLTLPGLVINLVIIWLSTLIVTSNCDNYYKSIYINPDRSSSIVYGTFKSSDLSLSTINLTKSIVDCKLVNYPKVVDELLASSNGEVKSLIQTIKNVHQFDWLAGNCSMVDLTPTQSPLWPLTKPRWSIFGIPNELLIAPGTKWCGPGNRSTGYDDLGSAYETDKCCRDHDYCPMFIDPGTTRYNITNDTPYTISRCDCDEQLKSCLKEASKSDLGASLFGIIYFNLLRIQCFNQVIPPILKGDCLEYSGSPELDFSYDQSNSTEPVYVLQENDKFT